MVYFHGVDIMTHTLSVTFDYDESQKDEVLKFVREKLGDQVTLNELSTFVEELKEGFEEE